IELALENVELSAQHIVASEILSLQKLLCYQKWRSGDSLIVGGDTFSPRRTYYEQRAPQWLDDLDEKARSGDMHDTNMPPFEQRQAWMAVRKALVSHYKIKDYSSYDNQHYPLSIKGLPAGYEPQWTNIS
ncbi:unnamed protein product, partial [Rotaria sp. Silwood2]